jgi:hypothetical protein
MESLPSTLCSSRDQRAGALEEVWSSSVARFKLWRRTILRSLGTWTIDVNVQPSSTRETKETRERGESGEGVVDSLVEESGNAPSVKGGEAARKRKLCRGSLIDFPASFRAHSSPSSTRYCTMTTMTNMLSILPLTTPLFMVWRIDKKSNPVGKILSALCSPNVTMPLRLGSCLFYPASVSSRLDYVVLRFIPRARTDGVSFDQAVGHSKCLISSVGKGKLFVAFAVRSCK